MQTKDETVSLTNLAEGGAVELFDMELQRVLQNMDNPNVIKDVEREITLVVRLKPTETPGMIRSTVQVRSKLAGRKTLLSHMAIGRGAQGMEAREINTGKQQPIFNNVVEIKSE